MKLELRMADGSARCAAVAPVRPLQCELALTHNQTQSDPLHRNGAVVWHGKAPFDSVRQGKADENESRQPPINLLGGIPLRLEFTGKYDHSPAFDEWMRKLKDSSFPVQFVVDPTIGHSEEPTPHGATELAQWWRDTAEAEIEQTVDKAIEYGSTDLIDIGRSIARVAGRNDGDFTDTDAALWGVFFYLEGKLSRWRSAIERGDQPSRDTLLDIGVYARMAQRIVEVGSWPGPRPAHTPTPSDSIFHMFCMPDDPCGPTCTATKTYPGRSAG